MRMSLIYKCVYMNFLNACEWFSQVKKNKKKKKKYM